MQIQAKQLSKTFRSKDRETTAYQDLTFDVSPGEFFCILGPSGCGKTSLLRTLAGLETPGTGELTIDSHTDQTADIAMVFQEHGLFPWMNLKNNIRFLLENNPQMTGRDLDLQQLLLSIWNETQKTVVFVTHDIEEAVLLADRIMVMSAHPGTIKTFIDIDLPRPRDVLTLQKQPAYHDHVNQILDLLQEESGYFNSQNLDHQTDEGSLT